HPRAHATVYAPAPEAAELAARLRARRDARLTSLETVHLPADDPSDDGAAAIVADLDVVVWLSRELASRGVYPPLDPLRSTSPRRRAAVGGPRHGRVAGGVRAVLQHRAALADAVEIAGLDALSDDDQRLVRRARRLERFLTQPLAATFAPADETG